MDDSTYTVVVGVDGSPSSREALRWAIGEARARNGRVRAIHAWVNFSEDFFAQDAARLRSGAQGRLDDVLAETDVGNVAFEAELIEGDARRVLVRAARDADLLVVGSRGRTDLTEMVLGSVSTFCVHHAPRPVVVVHSG